MGLRKDNHLWTVPGGHLEDGEAPMTGALRELKEESGIEMEPHHLKYLGSEVVTGHAGAQLEIHMFRGTLPEGIEPTTKNDPDKEAYGWHLVDTNAGLPKGIAENLHVPAKRNALLRKLDVLTAARLKGTRLSFPSIAGRRAPQFDQFTLLSAMAFQAARSRFQGVDENTSGGGRTMKEVSSDIQSAGKSKKPGSDESGKGTNEGAVDSKQPAGGSEPEKVAEPPEPKPKTDQEMKTDPKEYL